MPVVIRRRMILPVVAPLLLAAVCAFTPSLAAAATYIDLGDADGLALDQPTVAVEFWTQPNSGTAQSLGPDFSTSFVLDTGASTILAAGSSTSEMIPHGFQTVAGYDEAGVAGTSPMDVSDLYRLDFAGSDGLRQSVSSVRALSSTTLDLGGFDGIVGMPAMVGHAVKIDMHGWATGNSITLETTFPAAPPVTAHQYTVPLSSISFPLTGQRNPGDPLPSNAPLSTLAVAVSDSGHTVQSRFIIDTGAQSSIISTSLAFALGLDKNNDGSLADEAVGELPIGGIGGTVNMPQLNVGHLVLHTSEGVDLQWNNLTLGVLDIDPQISGIFGMDMLTNGWFNKVFSGAGPNGNFDQVNFDFRTPGQWRMLLSLEPNFDRPVATPEPSSLVLALAGAAALMAFGCKVGRDRRRARRQRTGVSRA